MIPFLLRCCNGKVTVIISQWQLSLCWLYGCWTPMPRVCWGVFPFSAIATSLYLHNANSSWLRIPTSERSIWRTWGSESSLSTRVVRYVGTEDGLQGMPLWCLVSMVFMKLGLTSVIVKNQSQICFGWFPASVDHLNTAATFSILKHFQLINFELKASPFEFYNTLAWLTDKTGLSTPKVYKSAPSCFGQFKGWWEDMIPMVLWQLSLGNAWCCALHAHSQALILSLVGNLSWMNEGMWKYIFLCFYWYSLDFYTNFSLPSMQIFILRGGMCQVKRLIPVLVTAGLTLSLSQCTRHISKHTVI